MLLVDYNIFSVKQFYELGINELRLMLRASKIRRVDKEYFISMQAWQNEQVRGVDAKTHERVIKTFTELYDYEQRMNAAVGKPTTGDTSPHAESVLDDEARRIMMGVN